MTDKNEDELDLEIDLDLYIMHSIFKIMSDSKYLQISEDSDIVDFTKVNILSKYTTYFTNSDPTILFSITQTDDGVYMFKSHCNTYEDDKDDNYIDIFREIHTIKDYKEAGRELAKQISHSSMTYSGEMATELYDMITWLSILYRKF